MPVGKESVQKRVRKTADSPTPAPKKETPVKASTVVGNVSPKVVEKVTGHPEESKPQVIQVTDDMPYYLL